MLISYLIIIFTTILIFLNIISTIVNNCIKSNSMVIMFILNDVDILYYIMSLLILLNTL